MANQHVTVRPNRAALTGQLLDELLEFGQGLERLERGHSIDIDRRDACGDRRRLCRDARARCRDQRELRRRRELRSALEAAHDLARARYDLLWQTGEPRDVDAVTLVRTAR